MFAPRQALLSAALCLALTVPTWASALKDENTSTNSNTFNTAPATPAATWTIETSKAAKVENVNHPLMSLNRGTLPEVCRILAENGHADAIANLGMSCIHMAGRILRPVPEHTALFKEHPERFNENVEDIRVNNPGMREAIRVELRKAINAREARIAAQLPQGEQAPFLAPWKEILGENASLCTLTWANDVLSDENVETLRQKRIGNFELLKQLRMMPDKTKALALGASAAQIFTRWASWHSYTQIIKAALQSSCPPSEYAVRAAACKAHLFTNEMDATHQSLIIWAALKASCPPSDYAVRTAACKAHLFTAEMNGHGHLCILEGALQASCPPSEYKARGALCRDHLFTNTTVKMDGLQQAQSIAAVLILSDAQIAQLMQECAARLGDDNSDRSIFIKERAEELLRGK